MDCDSFAVEDHGGKYEVVTLSSRSGISVTLGMYSSEEKALKVLDDIEKELKYPYDEVFQMPADDEVVTVKKRVDYAEFRMLEEKRKVMR